MAHVSAHYISSIIDKCVMVGAQRDALIACIPTGQAALKDPMQRLSVDCLIDVYAVAGNALGVRNIGLLVAQQFDMATLHETGKVLPSCATFREAIMMTGRYHRLTQTFARSFLEIEGDDAAMKWIVNYDDFERYRQVTAAIYTGFATGAKWLLWGRSDIIRSVQFRVSEPKAGAAHYEKIYGCPVHFGRDVDALIFNAHLLDTPISTANSEGFDAISQHLDGLLVKYDTDSVILDRVRATIRLDMAQGAPNAKRISGHLGVSERSIRYALSQSGTSFRREVEDARKEACLRFMKRGLRLMDISYRLGFHDQSAFNRAFKAWFGENPKNYQVRLLSS